MITNIVYDKVIEIGRIPLKSGKVSSFDISHDGKEDHKIFLSFEVVNNYNLQNKIDFYLLTQDEFDEWVLPKGTSSTSNSRSIIPKKFHKLFKGQPKLENYEIPISRSTRVHFLAEKGNYTAAKIAVHVQVQEEYNTAENKPQVYTSFSVASNSLSKKIKEIINSSKQSLKIISPYTDLHVIGEISSALDRGVRVMLITRKKEELKSQSSVMSFPRLCQVLKQNLKTNDEIHARLMISDERLVLLMTSDIEQNSMENLINCGVLITDTSVVRELSEFFNKIWSNSKNS